MKSFTPPGSKVAFPFVVTADEAEAARAELATALRSLAEEVESGRFDFGTWTLSVRVDRQSSTSNEDPRG